MVDKSALIVTLHLLSLLNRLKQPMQVPRKKLCYQHLAIVLKYFSIKRLINMQ